METSRTILKALLPGFLFIFLQSLVVLSFDPICFLIAGLIANAGGSGGELLAFAGREGNYLIGILGNGIFLIVGGYWLKSLVQTKGRRQRLLPLTWKTLLFLVCAGIGIQLGTDVILTVLEFLVSRLGEFYRRMMESLGVSYTQVMESLGLYAPTVCSVLYTVLFAPLAEELAFRGLTLKILEQSLPFRAANLLQALFFALIHGNLVQGAYAFLAGLFFGWLVRRYGTLKAPVFCHIAVNLAGLLLVYEDIPIPVMLLGALLFSGLAVILKKTEQKA